MIKQFFKKVLISYLIIICCIYTPTAQAASWSFGGFNFGNGSLNIVKDGVKITTAAVDSAPITSNLGVKILGGAIRGANILTAISIIAGLGEDAIDWVLDPANNAIKYKSNLTFVGTGQAGSSKGVAYNYNTAVAVYNNYMLTKYGNPLPSWVQEQAACQSNKDGIFCWIPNSFVAFASNTASEYKSIPIPTVAQKIQDIAKSGDTNAQADVTSAVTELVSAGTYNTPINQAIQQAIDNGTLPKDTDTNTDTNNPTNPQIDTSSIIAAIQSLASSFAKSLADNFNAITSVINTSIDKLLNKQDQIQGEVVNVGSKVDSVGGQVVGVGDKVDNVGGKVVGVGDAVKDVGGKVVGLNDSVDKVGDAVVGVGDKVDAAGDKVGQKVDAAGDKVGTRVDAVGEKVTGVGTRVDAVGEKVDAAGDKVGTRVDAVGEKVTGVGTRVDAVGEKVDAAGEKTAEAIKESTKEITDKMEQTKPKDFELPAFCSWASKVCDFIDDFNKKDDDSTDVDINDSNLPNIDTSITFGGMCPPNATAKFHVPYSNDIEFTLFDWSNFCGVLNDYVRPVVIALAAFWSVMIVGGIRTNGTS
ncbi:apolipoprotein A1/A4/E family protein [Moraxella osloensis]|nr:apolipoprotein A1/A4/E family protein [Moraxella osloensis]MBW4010687.1 apolipoprotein A1/A4/E family protein [Moraxella osloensis]